MTQYKMHPDSDEVFCDCGKLLSEDEQRDGCRSCR